MTKRFAGYEIDALIGRGGMADVYRARALEGPHAGQTVALKRLRPELSKDPQYLELFHREAAVTRRRPGRPPVPPSGPSRRSPSAS